VRRLDELGQAEVDDLRIPLGRDHDVVRFQVAVHDAGGVRLGQPVRGLGEDLQPPRERWMPGEKLAKRLPFDELHGDVVQLLGALLRGGRLHDVRGPGLPDLVDGHDVRVIQRGRGLRLLREAVDPLAVVGEDGREDLQGDVAAEPFVAGAVDVAHAARGDEVEDPIRPDAGAARQWLPRFFDDAFAYDFAAAEDGAHRNLLCRGPLTLITLEAEMVFAGTTVFAGSCAIVGARSQKRRAHFTTGAAHARRASWRARSSAPAARRRRR
jgi:hypothetical protein